MNTSKETGYDRDVNVEVDDRKTRGKRNGGIWEKVEDLKKAQEKRLPWNGNVMRIKDSHAVGEGRWTCR